MALLLSATSLAGAGAIRENSRLTEFDCAFRSADAWLDDLSSAVAAGKIAHPSTRLLPEVAPRRQTLGTVALPCISGSHIFPFEDTEQLLLTPFSNGLGGPGVLRLVVSFRMTEPGNRSCFGSKFDRQQSARSRLPAASETPCRARTVSREPCRAITTGGHQCPRHEGKAHSRPHSALVVSRASPSRA